MRAQGNYTILYVCVCVCVCVCTWMWKCPAKTSALKLQQGEEIHMPTKSHCLMHQPDAVRLLHTHTHTHSHTHTHTYTYRAQSPLAFRGQAKTRNIKARGEEGKIAAKRGREGRKERCSAPSPYVSLSLSLSLCVSGLRLRQTSWEAGSSTAW